MAADPPPLSLADIINAQIAEKAQRDEIAEGMRLDRVRLEQWWRDQMATVESQIIERRELLASAGEHPSEIFMRQARRFGALGIPRDVCATLLEISEANFEMHYGREYTVGSAETMLPVAQNLLRMATSMNDRVAVKAATEYLNRRGGEEWRPPAQKLEIADDRKAKGNLIDSSTLSWEDRQIMRGVLERALRRQVAGPVESGEGEQDGE